MKQVTKQIFTVITASAGIAACILGLIALTANLVTPPAQSIATLEVQSTPMPVGLSPENDVAYRVSLEAVETRHGQGPEPDIIGSMNFSGVIHLGRLGTDEPAKATLTLSQIDEITFTVAEQDALGVDELHTIPGQAVISYSKNNLVEGVACSPETAKPVCIILDAIARRSQLSAPGSVQPNSRWGRSEYSPSYETVTFYSLEHLDSDKAVIHKRYHHYNRLMGLDVSVLPQAVEALTSYTVDLDGRVDTIINQEKTVIGRQDNHDFLSLDAELDMAFLGNVPRSQANVLTDNFYELNQNTDASHNRMVEKLLRNRAGGWTLDTVQEKLTLFGPGGLVPHHKEFLWRAVAVIRLNPRELANLEQAWWSQTQTHKGRTLMADLLAGAGTPEAQALLVDLLDQSQSYNTTEERIDLSQRLSFVDSPTIKTLNYVEDLATKSEGALQRAAKLTMGASIAALDASTQTSEKERLNQQLLSYLEQETDISNTIHALGNAGMQQNLDTIIEYADHEDPSTRAAVADAIRSLGDNPRIDDALLQLAGDSDGWVQRRALSQLSERELSDPHYSSLAQIVGSGPIDATLGATLLTLAINEYKSCGGQSIAEAMLTHQWPAGVQYQLVRAYRAWQG